MIEALLTTEIRKVTSKEYPQLIERFAEFKALIEQLKLVYKDTQFIDEEGWQSLSARQNEVVRLANAVVVKSVEAGLKVAGKPGEVDTFIHGVRKDIAIALEEIDDYRVQYTKFSTIDPSAKQSVFPVKVRAFRVPLFVEQYLQLTADITSEKKKPDPATSFDVLREHYRALKILPLVHLTSEFEDELDEIKTDTPEVNDNVPPLLEKAKLTDDEVIALDLLLQVKVTAPEERKWLVGNPEALVNFLKRTQIFEGGTLGPVPTLRIQQLRESLEAALEKTYALRIEASINTDIKSEEYLKTLNLSEDRIKEIISLLNGVINTEDMPQFTVWRDTVIKDFTVYETIPNGESSTQFLKRIEPKLSSGTKLEEAEVKDLTKILRHLQAQQKIIDLIEYPDPNKTGINTEIKEKKNEFIQQEISRIEALRQQNNELQDNNLGRRDALDAQNNDAKLALVSALYNEMSQYNPDLPSLESLRPEMLQTFMQELMIAVYKFIETIHGRTSSSGGTARAIPSSKVNLWSGEEIKVTLTDIEGDRTLETLFRDLPWDRLMPGITPEEKKEWTALWMYRFIHQDMMHNYAADFREIEPIYGKPEEPERIMSLVKGKQADNGLYPGDMVPFYKRMHGKDEPLSRFFEFGEEEYWKFPEFVNYLLDWIEKYVPNYSTKDAATEDALSKFKPLIIAKLAPYRTEKNGKFKDDAIVEAAWRTAIWTMYPTLRIIAYDGGALTFRTARMVNKQENSTKYIRGRQNGGDRLTYTAIQQLARTWPPRSEYINMMVKLSPEMYETYTRDDLKVEIETYETELLDPAMSPAIAALPRPPYTKEMFNPAITSERANELVRRITALDKILIEIKVRSVGEYEDLKDFEDVGRVERRLAEMPHHSAYDKEQYDILKFYYDYLLQIAATELGMPVPSLKNDIRSKYRTKNSSEKSTVDAAIRKAATDYAISRRYSLVRIRPEYRRLPEIEEEMNERAPVIIPLPAFRSDIREDDVQMTDDEVIKSGLDPQYVDYATITPNHGTRWAEAAELLLKLEQFADYKNKEGIFAPIHDPHLDGKIKRVAEYFPLIGELKYDAVKLRTMTSSDMKKLAKSMSDLLASKIMIQHIEVDDYVVTWGSQHVTKTLRYAMGPLLFSGAKVEGHPQLVSPEQWTKMFRRVWKKFDKTFTHLNLETPDATDLKNEIRTIVESNVRLAADAAYGTDEQGRPMRNAAINQMIVEMFIICFGMWADRYRYKSIEEGAPLPVFHDQLDAAYGSLHLMGEDPSIKPMDTPHWMLAVRLGVKTIHSFLSDDFGGTDFEANQNNRIMRTYSEEFLIQMLIDRGIIGSAEQFIADAYYYVHILPTLKHGAPDPDKKGGHGHG